MKLAENQNKKERGGKGDKDTNQDQEELEDIIATSRKLRKPRL